MTLFYNVIIAPIEAFIEFVFVFYTTKIGLFGIAGAIVAVSLAVNFLALPIYNVADSLQEKERNIQKLLSPRVQRIKQAFSGDERFMMLQTFYRENHYHPLYALRSSLSILIEIPFFIAAYHFLSNAEILKSAHFYFLRDFGSPDSLFALNFGAKKVAVNVLPILMTLINFVSGAIYLKKATIKEKIQLYVLALLFLVLLYNSPSGLVCYWILNNLFSLVKNIVNAKCKNRAKFVHKAVSAIVIFSSVFLLTKQSFSIVKRLAFLAFAILVCVLPIAKKIFERTLSAKKNADTKTSTALRKQFLLSAAGLTLLAGFLLPSSIISTSPVEFSYIGETQSPLSYIFSCFTFFAGLFLFWPTLIYKMFGTKVQKIISPLFVFIFFLALLNVYVFTYRYGTFTIFFQLDESKNLKNYSPFFSVLPLFCAFALFFLATKSAKPKWKNLSTAVLTILCFSEAALGLVKTLSIKREYLAYTAQRATESEDMEIKSVYHLSKTKKNVVVLFLDRAMSCFVPYIVKEFPEIEEQFSGFTFYPNTVSFSTNTAKAAPAMLAGYEYTPENINKRENERLKDKHNEASLVMPKLFLDAGFDVTITDPPFPNYTWKGDLSAFKQYSEIHSSEIIGNYVAKYKKDHPEFLSLPRTDDFYTKKFIISFCLLETLPPMLRNTYYAGGKYYRAEGEVLVRYSNNNFLKNWTNLYYLPELTQFDNEKDTYTFIDNETTHEYTLLENKTYVPTGKIDEKNFSCGFYDYAVPPHSEMESDAQAYHVNAAALLQVAKWLEYLKGNDCYDNTRIIIVSDHGRYISLPQFREMQYGTEYAGFTPLFMVKDFYATGKLKTDDTFMTNADTIFFATADLPVSKKNPFTKNVMTDFIKKDSIALYPVITTSDFNEWNPIYFINKNLWILQDEKNHTPSYIVRENIFDEKNWQRIVK